MTRCIIHVTVAIHGVYKREILQHRGQRSMDCLGKPVDTTHVTWAPIIPLWKYQQLTRSLVGSRAKPSSDHATRCQSPAEYK